MMSRIFFLLIVILSCKTIKQDERKIASERERISINSDWKFFRYEAGGDDLIYDVRPKDEDFKDSKDADSRPEEANTVEQNQFILKPWIMPTGNKFLADESKEYRRPEGWPGRDFPFVQKEFDDKNWLDVELPHDWAIEGPFMTGANPIIGGGMGRLPVHGVAWYRKKIYLDENDKDLSIFLDIDGAMSYSMVWINGYLVGGWPYGYNSYRLDITDFVKSGTWNQIAIRLDNPPKSARWYPGAGLYRNVWLEKVNKLHVGHWGTYITSENVSVSSAETNITTIVENDGIKSKQFVLTTTIFQLDEKGSKVGGEISSVSSAHSVASKSSIKIKEKILIPNPKLWGPPPHQKPHMYCAISTLVENGKVIDRYETNFGIRNIRLDPDKGIAVNGEYLKIFGVNQHHDLGALGAAFNVRAAERQLEVLRELGCNSIRMAHNPPAPELLDLTDRYGFLVVNEIFDVWERRKTPYDFHLIFPDWFEQDVRSFVRRDKNHPSVILWSYGNEVGEQYTEESGAQLSKKLKEIIKDEDPSRLTTVSMNYSKPEMPFTREAEVISLNYQGEGIRNAQAYRHLKGITTEPLYPAFKAKYPDRSILSSETASAFSTRGAYLFPVYEGNSAPIAEGKGGDSSTMEVSAYELYTANFGSSADKVFATQDQNPYVGGEWVWTGWDYLGEPTPYYDARSSYCGIIDLAGFPKDRYFLYQSRWRPELKIVHILPHWNWPERVGKITPVHIFTSGDEVELFLNQRSLGRKKKAPYEYRLRWDEVVYEPGELKAVVYKNGKFWTEQVVKTTGSPAKIKLTADRANIQADGKDLSFITAEILDKDGNLVRNASNGLTFEVVSGPGVVVATDNGNPADMNAFKNTNRNALSGMALGIIKGKLSIKGDIVIKVTAPGLQGDEITIRTF